MAYIKDDHLYLEDNERINFGNAGYIYSDGTTITFVGDTNISGAQGPVGPPGATSAGNKISDSDDTTNIFCSDSEHISFKTDNDDRGAICLDGCFVWGVANTFTTAGDTAHFLKNTTNTTKFGSYSAGDGNVIQIERSKGSYSAQQAVVATDTIGQFDFRGHDGTDMSIGARIKATVDGIVANNRVPTRLDFYTEDSSGNLNINLSVDSDKNIYLNSGVGVKGIIDDLADADGASLVTDLGVIDYVDDQFESYETTISGLFSDKIYYSDQTSVECDGNSITHDIGGIDELTINSNGITLASGTSINYISTDSSISMFEPNKALLTAGAIKDYVLGVGGGGGLITSYEIHSDDEKTQVQCLSDYISMKLNSKDAVRWTDTQFKFNQSGTASAFWPTYYNTSQKMSYFIQRDGVVGEGPTQESYRFGIGLHYSDDTAWDCARITFNKSRGSASSPLTNEEGDYLGQIDFHSYAYTAFADWDMCASIRAILSGEVSSSYHPTSLEFWTTEDRWTAGDVYTGGQKVMTLTHDGYILPGHENTGQFDRIITSDMITIDPVSKQVNTPLSNTSLYSTEATYSLCSNLVEWKFNLLAAEEGGFDSIQSTQVGFNADLCSVSCTNYNGIYATFNYGNIGNIVQFGNGDNQDAGNRYWEGIKYEGRKSYKSVITVENNNDTAYQRRAGSWIHLFRSKGSSDAISLRRQPVIAGDLLGGIAAIGHANNNGENQNPCDHYSAFRYGGAISFTAAEVANNYVDANIDFWTGQTTTGYQGLQYHDANYLRKRMSIIANPARENQNYYILMTDGKFNDYKSNGGIKSYGHVELMYGNTDNKADLAVMTTLQPAAVGTGGSIVLGGRFKDTGTGWAAHPETTVGVAPFALIKGSKDLSSFTNQAGRFHVQTHVHDGQLRTNMLIRSNGKVVFGRSDIGQGMDDVGGLTVNQTSNTMDRGIVTQGPTAGAPIYIWSNDVNGHIDVGADRAGKLTIGWSGEVGISCIPSNDFKLEVEGDFGPAADNSYNIGAPSKRWDDIYATNGTIQTSDEREKEGIKDSGLGLNFLMKLKPRQFKRKGGKRRHFGLVAQEVEKTLKGMGIRNEDFAGLIIGSNGEYGLRYEEFIPIIIKAIQDMEGK